MLKEVLPICPHHNSNTFIQRQQIVSLDQVPGTSNGVKPKQHSKNHSLRDITTMQWANLSFGTGHPKSMWSAQGVGLHITQGLWLVARTLSFSLRWKVIIPPTIILEIKNTQELSRYHYILESDCLMARFQSGRRGQGGHRWGLPDLVCPTCLLIPLCVKLSGAPTLPPLPAVLQPARSLLLPQKQLASCFQL